MLIVRVEGRPQDERVQRVLQHLHALRAPRPVLMEVDGTTALLVEADERRINPDALRRLPGVAYVGVSDKPYPLASRDAKPQSTTVEIGTLRVGGDAPPVVIAGPCSVETRSRMLAAAEAVKAAGAHLLRGGAYKPRTNPYSFQGLGEAGLQLLKEAGELVGLPTITEVVAPEDVELVAQYVDVLQIGARNMSNFRLLREVGRSRKPVLLKRGAAATVTEWLQAAEYLLAEGNERVILCERGVRSFETATRNMLDLAGAVLAKQLTHLPVLVDPSHATGIPDLIGPLSAAAVAAGIDGLIVEVHPSPAEAWSDGAQALTPDLFRQLMERVNAVAGAIGRPLGGAETDQRRVANLA